MHLVPATGLTRRKMPKKTNRHLNLVVAVSITVFQQLDRRASGCIAIWTPRWEVQVVVDDIRKYLERESKRTRNGEGFFGRKNGPK
jgi:hypothetical protein